MSLEAYLSLQKALFFNFFVNMKSSGTLVFVVLNMCLCVYGQEQKIGDLL